MTAEDGNDKLLLAAKKIRRATCTEFVISLVADNFSRSSSTYIGKLRQVVSYNKKVFELCNILLYFNRLFWLLISGQILWAQSLRYMTTNLQMMQPLNLKVSWVGDCIQLHVTTTLLPFHMSLMSSAQEGLGEWIAICIQFLSPQFRKEAQPQHQYHYQTLLPKHLLH